MEEHKNHVKLIETTPNIEILPIIKEAERDLSPQKPDIRPELEESKEPMNTSSSKGEDSSRKASEAEEDEKKKKVFEVLSKGYLSYLDPRVATVRPTVIKDLEVHLIFIVHGIGAKMEMLSYNMKKFCECIDEVRQSKPGIFPGLLHMKMIEWKSTLRPETQENIEKITLKNNSSKRMIINSVPSDIIFYLAPEHSREIMKHVVWSANEYYKYALTLFPKLKVSFLTHSLGSVIIYDILKEKLKPDGGAEELRFLFDVEHNFAIGSPLGLFSSIHENGQITLLDREKCVKGYYNIFHPQDLVAYRIEPMIPGFPTLDPFELPFHENEGYRRHKAGNGHIFKRMMICNKLEQKIYGQEEWSKFKRYDFQLQEKEIESIFETLGLIRGHFSYWNNKDFAYFILRRIHGMTYAATVNVQEDIV